MDLVNDFSDKNRLRLIQKLTDIVIFNGGNMPLYVVKDYIRAIQTLAVPHSTDYLKKYFYKMFGYLFEIEEE